MGFRTGNSIVCAQAQMHSKIMDILVTCIKIHFTVTPSASKPLNKFMFNSLLLLFEYGVSLGIHVEFGKFLDGTKHF